MEYHFSLTDTFALVVQWSLTVLLAVGLNRRIDLPWSAWARAPLR